MACDSVKSAMHPQRHSAASESVWRQKAKECSAFSYE